MASYIERTLAKIEHFERTIPWMYLNAAGIVTVGVGIVLPELATAKHLPFQIGARPATQEEIAAAFTHVAALPTGRSALFYRRQAGPELELPVIDALLRTALVGLEENLREHIRNYDVLPSPAKMALLDMAHNLTPSILLAKYPHLLRAIAARNWPQAATRSFRYGPGAARNQWTAFMFRVAAADEPTAGPIKRLAYGLIGLAATLAVRIRAES